MQVCDGPMVSEDDDEPVYACSTLGDRWPYVLYTVDEPGKPPEHIVGYYELQDGVYRWTGISGSDVD